MHTTNAQNWQWLQARLRRNLELAEARAECKGTVCICVPNNMSCYIWTGTSQQQNAWTPNKVAKEYRLAANQTITLTSSIQQVYFPLKAIIQCHLLIRIFIARSILEAWYGAIFSIRLLHTYDIRSKGLWDFHPGFPPDVTRSFFPDHWPCGFWDFSPRCI